MNTRPRTYGSARAWVFLPWLLPLAVGAAPAGLDRAEIADLFSQAKEFYRQANDCAAAEPDRARELYQRSVLRFECIAREGGVANGKLYYNIGNVYFRMKDIGRAILNYRRAEALTPRDANLQQNLSQARARRMDAIEEREQTRVLRTVFFWHYDLSTGVRAAVFTICFALLWVAAAARLLTRRPGLRRLMAACGALALLSAGSLAVEAAVLRSWHPGVILAEEVVARKGDSETFEPAFTAPLHAGTEFRVIEDRGEWINVELADGRRCWLPAKAVERVRM